MEEQRFENTAIAARLTSNETDSTMSSNCTQKKIYDQAENPNIIELVMANMNQ
jgi:hypothetical protein